MARASQCTIYSIYIANIYDSAFGPLFEGVPMSDKAGQRPNLRLDVVKPVLSSN